MLQNDTIPSPKIAVNKTLKTLYLKALLTAIYLYYYKALSDLSIFYCYTNFSLIYSPSFIKPLFEHISLNII